MLAARRRLHGRRRHPPSYRRSRVCLRAWERQRRPRVRSTRRRRPSCPVRRSSLCHPSRVVHPPRDCHAASSGWMSHVREASARRRPNHLASRLSHRDRHARCVRHGRLGHGSARDRPTRLGRCACGAHLGHDARRARGHPIPRPSHHQRLPRECAWADGIRHHGDRHRGCASGMRHRGWADVYLGRRCGWVGVYSHHLSEPRSWSRAAGCAGHPAASAASRMAIVAGDSGHS